MRLTEKRRYLALSSSANIPTEMDLEDKLINYKVDKIVATWHYLL